MPTYTFRAMDVAGVAAKGEVEASSKQDVAEQLKQRGLIVLDIAGKYKSKELNLELFARVKADEMAVFTRQLATMVSSGMTILRSLDVLEIQCRQQAAQGVAGRGPRRRRGRPSALRCPGAPPQDLRSPVCRHGAGRRGGRCA